MKETPTRIEAEETLPGATLDGKETVDETVTAKMVREETCTLNSNPATTDGDIRTGADQLSDKAYPNK